MRGAIKWMKGQQSGSIQNLFEVLKPFQNQKFEPSIQEFLSQISESITVGLDACQISIFND